MKTAITVCVLISGVLLTSTAHAQSPRDQFQQMMEQLQQSPNDTALREKIITLAPTLKPAPALPDAAVTNEGRARFAFGHAKSENDYLVAAKEYEKAVAAAPWVLNLYSDLCMAYEKAGKFVDAKRNCGFYLIGLTDPAEITEVKGRIAGLEFGIEKANAPQAREATLLEKVEGARFVCDHNFSQTIGTHYADILEIKGGELYCPADLCDGSMPTSKLKKNIANRCVCAAPGRASPPSPAPSPRA